MKFSGRSQKNLSTPCTKPDEKQADTYHILGAKSQSQEFNIEFQRLPNHLNKNTSILKLGQSIFLFNENN